jgi:hypothetical protein
MLNSIHNSGQQYIYARPGQFKAGDIVRTINQGVTIQARVTTAHNTLTCDVVDMVTGTMHKAQCVCIVDSVTFKKVVK